MKTLSGSEPHSSWGGWQGFLYSCEVRDTISTSEGSVVYYGKTNCNYILMPNGYIVQNFGFNGSALMARIRKKGWVKVWKQIESAYNELKELLAC